MKKMTLLLIVGLATKFAASQVLITYGKYNISKDEFLKAYNKNKTATEEDKEKSIREYVELFTNFKLKVRAALDQKIDTSNQIKNDLENFRHQVEENYLNDETTFTALFNEALERSRYELRVINYSIPIHPSDRIEDTAIIFQTIQSFYNTLQSSERLAEAPPTIQTADLGYIGVFTLPYRYENIVYGLKKGAVSVPYRSKNAWHIFKVIDKRESVGKWKIAQILFTFPPNPDAVIKKSIQQKADSVYELLKKGADFSKIATQYSEDKLSNTNGGEMPEFGTGKFDYTFEKEVFDLKEDGMMSLPFETSFGIHIVKRIKNTPYPVSDADESLRYEIRQKLMQSERVMLSKEKFYSQISKKIGLAINTNITSNDLYKYADSVVMNISVNTASKQAISNKTLFTIKKETTIKGKDWLMYVRDYKLNNEMYAGETNEQIWKRFLEKTCTEYYKKHLELYNTEFADQLQEFKEGNLLFEIMDREVWTRAAADSAGLFQYYNANKPKYLWGPSADVLIMNCATEDLAQEIMNELKTGKTWQELVQLREGEIQADSNRFELVQINISDSANPGSYSDIIKNPDGTASFTKYYRFYEGGLQRSFRDSKVLLINDYQLVLEKKWIEQLRKRYPVKINEPLLKAILQEK